MKFGLAFGCDGPLTFEELLQQKGVVSPQKGVQQTATPIQQTGSAKRPFLKRGSGILANRYTVNRPKVIGSGRNPAKNTSTPVQEKKHEDEEEELEEFKRIEQTVQRELGFHPSPSHNRNQKLTDLSHTSRNSQNDGLTLDEVPLFDDEDEWGELGDNSVSEDAYSPLKHSPQRSPQKTSRGILGLDPARHKSKFKSPQKSPQKSPPKPSEFSNQTTPQLAYNEDEKPLPTRQNGVNQAPSHINQHNHPP